MSSLLVPSPPVRRRWLALTLAAVTAVTGVLVAAAPAHAGGNAPVYFVHGADAIPFEPAYDCAMWNTMIAKLRLPNHQGNPDNPNDDWNWGGWTGKAHKVAYYAGDTNCNTRVASGGAGTRLAAFAQGLSHHIYNTYSKAGVYVNVVAHSMGGLIIRRAIDGASKGQPGFSPPIRVNWVVTLGTPHQGTDKAALCASYNAGCKDMKPFSNFMIYMRENAWSPNGVGATYWLAIGSDKDGFVTRVSAVGMGADHQKVYTNNYGHGGFPRNVGHYPFYPCDWRASGGSWTHSSCWRVITYVAYYGFA